MHITLSPWWAARCSDDAVLRAGLAAKCLREGDPFHETGEVTTCHCSGGRHVIEVGLSTRAAFGPHPLPDGSVRYTFDRCRSHCSSSRDHLHGRVILAVSELPGLPFPIISPGMALCAREKAPRRLSAAAGASAAAGPRLTPSDAPAPSSVGDCVQGAAAATDGPDTGKEMVPISRGAKPIAGGVYLAALVPKPQLLLPPLPFVSGAGHCVVVTRVFATILPPPEMHVLVMDFKPRVACLPGYVDFRVKVVQGYAISFSFFNSPETAERTTTVVKKYQSGEEQPPENPLHVDLAQNGMAVLLSVCTSY